MLKTIPIAGAITMERKGNVGVSAAKAIGMWIIIQITITTYITLKSDREC